MVGIGFSNTCSSQVRTYFISLPKHTKEEEPGSTDVRGGTILYRQPFIRRGVFGMQVFR